MAGHATHSLLQNVESIAKLVVPADGNPAHAFPQLAGSHLSEVSHKCSNGGEPLAFTLRYGLASTYDLSTNGLACVSQSGCLHHYGRRNRCLPHTVRASSAYNPVQACADCSRALIADVWPNVTLAPQQNAQRVNPSPYNFWYSLVTSLSLGNRCRRTLERRRWLS